MQHCSFYDCLLQTMKVFPFFQSCVCAALLLTTVSCNKTSVTPKSIKDLQYDNSYPIAGDWVLKCSDGGVGNTHIEYPLDGSTPFPGGSNIISWASHLVLLVNDSAYWNSSGYDANPEFFAKGIYSLLVDGNDHPAIDLSFTIGGFSKFEYGFKTKDTLVLNDLADSPAYYTYFRR